MYDEKLVTENVNLIYDILKKLQIYDRQEEYIDIGYIGLIKAAKTFDINKKLKFSTYACTCIRNEIVNYLMYQQTSKEKININTVSLNKPITFIEGLYLQDELKSDVDIESLLVKKEQLEKLYAAISKLNEREKKIIYCAYGLPRENKTTLKELAKEFNISSQRVMQIRNESLVKLRDLMEEKSKKL